MKNTCVFSTILPSYLIIWKFQNKTSKRKRIKVCSEKKQPQQSFPSSASAVWEGNRAERKNETGRLSNSYFGKKSSGWSLKACPSVFLEMEVKRKQSYLSYCLLSALLLSCHNNKEKKILCPFSHNLPDSSESTPKGQSQRLLQLLLLNTKVSHTLSMILGQKWRAEFWRAADQLFLEAH